MRIDETANPPTWVRIAKLNSNNGDEVEEKLKNAALPKLEEPCLVHPFNTSIVKIRNNGIIDMWAKTDQGVRIDPNTRTVNVITDGYKQHINYGRAWVMEDMEWWVKKSVLFECEQSFFKVNATGDITLNTKSNLNTKSEKKTIVTSDDDMIITSHANIDVEASGHLNSKSGSLDILSYSNGKLHVNGDLVISAGGSIAVNAGGSLTLTGSTIYEN